jgi:hypothetical protein
LLYLHVRAGKIKKGGPKAARSNAALRRVPSIIETEPAYQLLVEIVAQKSLEFAALLAPGFVFHPELIEYIQTCIRAGNDLVEFIVPVVILLEHLTTGSIQNKHEKRIGRGQGASFERNGHIEVYFLPGPGDPALITVHARLGMNLA